MSDEVESSQEIHAGGTAKELYSPGQVAGATFLGAPIAGALLLADNYRELGNLAARRAALIWGSIATLVLLVLGGLLPEGFPGSAIPIAYTAASFQLAKNLQGKAFDSCINSGGHKQPTWRVVGIGLVCGIVIFACLFALMLMLPGSSGSSL